MALVQSGLVLAELTWCGLGGVESLWLMGEVVVACLIHLEQKASCACERVLLGARAVAVAVVAVVDHAAWRVAAVDRSLDVRLGIPLLRTEAVADEVRAIHNSKEPEPEPEVLRVGVALPANDSAAKAVVDRRASCLSFDPARQRRSYTRVSKSFLL